MSNLSWEEAKEEMRKGKRMANTYFSPEEYFEMNNGAIVCEDGYSMAGWFRNEDWQKTGWHEWVNHE